MNLGWAGLGRLGFRKASKLARGGAVPPLACAGGRQKRGVGLGAGGGHRGALRQRSRSDGNNWVVEAKGSVG